jgi:hypothetical protein
MYTQVLTQLCCFFILLMQVLVHFTVPQLALGDTFVDVALPTSDVAYAATSAATAATSSSPEMGILPVSATSREHNRWIQAAPVATVAPVAPARQLQAMC